MKVRVRALPVCTSTMTGPPKIKDLASKTTITKDIRVVFTISGTGHEGPAVTTTEQTTTTTEKINYHYNHHNYRSNY